jgi:hypothetical protein
MINECKVVKVLQGEGQKKMGKMRKLLKSSLQERKILFQE